MIPGLGRFPGERKGNLLQYSCLRNPMDTGVWWATVHGVAKSQTQLSTWYTPMPVCLPGEFLGQRGLAGYSPWGRKESDTTEQLHINNTLLLFCVPILLIFDCLILKLQLKILIYLLKKIIVIYSGTKCNFVLYFPSLL